MSPISLFYIFVFPGFLFLSVLGLLLEFMDRKLYARFQNRIGPPWYQPLADIVKLSAKEAIVPAEADAFLFKAMPLLAFASSITAIIYIPIWSTRAIFSFYGDVIVVIYLLTLPTFALFLGGWCSTSLYSMIGAVRALTQLFAYEVPLFLAILSPALLAGTWSLSQISAYYTDHPQYAFFNIVGFAVALIALLGKLEKTPFDIPEAETEIVGGSLTEYSGRYLGFFRIAVDIEMVVGASLLAAVFLPFGIHLTPLFGFVLYLLKVLFIVFLLSLARSIFARLRIEQMMQFCWRYVAPAAIFQILFIVILKGFVL